MLTQIVTPPIMITDDHKTPTLPALAPHSAVYSDGMHLAGSGIFSGESLGGLGFQYQPQHSYSTPNLQGLRHNMSNPYHFGMQTFPAKSHYSNVSSRRTSPFAAPHNPSQQTSATMTPRNLSRQASPSGPNERDAKRRKASGTYRMSDRKIPDLSMTRMDTSDSSSDSNRSSASAESPLEMPNEISNTAVKGRSNAITDCISSGVPNGLPAIATNSHRIGTASFNPTGGNGLTSSLRDSRWTTTSSFNSAPYNSNPSTPSTTATNMYQSFHRPQSSGSFAVHQATFSAPTSAPGSRPQSPGIRGQDQPSSQAHAQALANSLSNVRGASHSQMQPRVLKVLPNEGPMAGGVEVTCLGTGFYPGLEVMFGDAVATVSTSWGDQTIVCIVPPASRPGAVSVTFRHLRPWPPRQQVEFTYVDTDEHDLIRQTLALLNHQYTGQMQDASEIARNFMTNQASRSGSWAPSPSQISDQQRQVAMSSLVTAQSTDVESAILRCFDLMDLSESPVSALWNWEKVNGQTLLHLAASLGFRRIVAGLLARGANPDIRDKNGMTPMHMACLRGYIHVVRKLLSAGGDPAIRSLRGFAPADMASSQEMLEEFSATERHTRSRSAGATPRSFHSRASSLASLRSLRPSHHLATESTEIIGIDDESEHEMWPEESLVRSSSGMTPAQLWVQSRRNSACREQQYLVGQSRDDLAANTPTVTATAISAWRDQLAAQIHQFQNLHWTLPNLQILNLPPLPNLPDYQDYPMVRRISSLVPQLQNRQDVHSRHSEEPKDGNKESDNRWWEWLKRPSSSPPAYDEIYPEKAQADANTKQASSARAVGDALLDSKCEVTFDRQSAQQLVPLHSHSEGSSHGTAITDRNKEPVTLAVRSVQGLRSDKRLFIVWVWFPPLLSHKKNSLN